MQITESLKSQITGFEAQLRAHASEAVRSERGRAQARREAARIKAAMGFRERYLHGWFGGDKGKIAQYNRQRALEAKFNETARFSDRKVATLNTDIHRIIDSSLRENDPSYQELVKPYDAAVKVKVAIDGFLGKIDSALSEIDGAQSMETMDLFTKNAGIAALSYLENTEAKDAVGRVKAAVPAFQKAVNAYDDVLKAFQAPQLRANIGDGVDLAFDLAFDDFDIMSIFTLSALEDAEKNMREVRTKANEADRIVIRNLDKTKAAVDAYIRHVRTLCA